MTDILKQMTEEESKAFTVKFLDDVQGLIKNQSVDGRTLNMVRNEIMRQVLILKAGCLEAMQKASYETALALGKLDPRLMHFLERESQEGVYDLYTAGYNAVIKVADEKEGEISTMMSQFYESVEQTKKEESK